MPTPTARPALALLSTPLGRAAALALACTLAASGASAQVFKEPALNALYNAERFAELERVALKRLTTQADDAQAVLATAMVAMISNDSPKREAVIQLAESCLQQAPQAAPCHYALGSVLGIHAMSQGLMKVVGNVTRVKTALVRAMELEPQWYLARSAVVEFYLQAPAIAGGSSARAAEVAKAAARPEQAHVLEARVAIKEERYDAAVAQLAQVKPGTDTAVADDALQLWISAGIGLLGKGQREQARAVFEGLMKDQPDSAAGPYGLARLHTEAGNFTEAVALLEQCARLKGADRLPLDYRMGIALQGQGKAEAARSAFSRFVAHGRGSRNALEDARKRIAQLG
ncbi:MAG: tetratricopeptide repeat protein [Burkholderiales bacterium]|nr:tetratricopeptide repeat protein [Burkholderiales bacterium]